MKLGTSQAIDTQTVMYGVFGDPIAHSKSPLMLNRAFSVKGLNAAYAAFRILPGTLKNAVNGIRALNFRGVNVTIPHKVEVMAYLDEIDEHARMIGAVNTIVNDNGKLIGYNTDGIGYVRSLKEEAGFSIEDKKFLVIGAGGAARGIGFALAKENAGAIWIANRTVEKAASLASDLGDWTTAKGISLEETASVIKDVDVVIHTTQVGMHPNVNELPIDASILHENLLVSDIVYNPRITKLLSEAKARGARIHEGLGMFIYQGAFAFEYWTGEQAPIAAMREIVELALQSES